MNRFVISNVDIEGIRELVRNSVEIDASKFCKIEAPIPDIVKNASNIRCIKDDRGDELFIVSTTTSSPQGNKELICRICQDKFTHDNIGYPTHYEEKIMTREGKCYTRHILWTKRVLCSYECSLGYIRNSRECDFHNEQLLHLMYRFQYPKDPPLVPSPPLDVIEDDSFSMEEWRKKKHIYIRCSSLLIIPMSSDYLETSSKVVKPKKSTQ